MARKKLWFMAESKGHLVCVDAKALLVSDASTVNLGDDLKFKYGAQTLPGKISFISDNEKDVLDQMALLTKQGKQAKPEETFDGKKPRSAKEKANKLLAGTSTPGTSTSLKTPKALQKSLKKKRKMASHHLEDETPTLQDIMLPNEKFVKASSDSDSDSSSYTAPSTDSKKKGRVSDAKLLDELSDSDDKLDLNKDSQTKSRKRPLSDSDSCDEKHKKPGDAKGNVNEQKIPETKTDDESSEKIPDKKSPETDDSKVSSEKTPDKKSPMTVDHKVSPETKTDDKVGLENKSEIVKVSPEKTPGKKSPKTPKKTKKKVKRNTEVYDGVNYQHCESSKNVMKVNENYDVFISKAAYEKAKAAKTPTIALGIMVDDIYTVEAIQNSSAFGFPPRGKGKEALKTVEVLPRIHPDGFEATKVTILQLQVDNKTWRPKATEKTLTNAFSSRICRAHKKQDSSEEESEDSEDEEDGKKPGEE